ncbi:cytosolic endo-beta-N-acetylglucosaminidase-like [Cimex lectularius]|uniref:Cytosolic endo-beta-N-acetylglucosaminidase TIM barrel domain-containing protein n=1 Tax=Cimex lectularius TaxID=79782 RepID=A0A8I6SDG3_CIMLE|nr:cytosolic endo-beta-N-acetylglucosaminidase-like [Cimex lectularius]
MEDPNTDSVCRPFTHVDMIIDWRAPEVTSTWAFHVVELRRRSNFCVKGYSKCTAGAVPPQLLKRSECPKTLYCHDMQGGYLEDKYSFGSQKKDEFQFFRWSGIDIFVYFTRNLLTVPPLGWINAAHRNGVIVLGTLVSEPGTECIWDLILHSDESVDNFAINMASICFYYGFEGYLLNIEHDIVCEKVELFIYFIETLRRHLKSIDEDNLLIFYDSLTYPEGRHEYQNVLNDNNWVYFNLTDGIFINYNWLESYLSSMKEYLNVSPDRVVDVFLGVDVYGRGSQNGEFRTDKTIEKVRKYGMSVALFAPSWVYESSSNRKEYIQNDYQFWNQCYEHMYIAGTTVLPFQTCFSIGHGNNYYENGNIRQAGPWYNLARMAIQPSETIGYEGYVDNTCMCYYELDAYKGGGCLLIKQYEGEPHYDRLFMCDFKVRKNDKLIFKYVSKNNVQGTDTRLEFLIAYTNEDFQPSTRCITMPKDAPEVMSPDEHIGLWLTHEFVITCPADISIIEIALKLVGDRVSELLLGKLYIDLIQDQPYFDERFRTLRYRPWYKNISRECI